MDSSLHQAPLSMRFSRQEYWGGVPFPFTFLESNIFGIRQCEVFSDWALLLSNVNLGFLHVFSLCDSSEILLSKNMFVSRVSLVAQQ